MQALRLRAEEGERIRVLEAGAVRDHERRRPLPELVILGTTALYQVLYDETGAPSGARRIPDSEVIGQCRVEMTELWDRGEPLPRYFDREIASLPPPPAQR